MSYETRAYDNEHGDPVVVLVATGTHDVSRLVNLLKSGNCEQVGLGSAMLRQVRRHNGGRAALQLLAAHGGPDFLHDGPPAECKAETYSWDHFNSEQVDGYWIRCTLLGTHAEHQDEHTGLSWTATAPGMPAGAPERARELAETMPTVGQWPGVEGGAGRG